MGFSIKNTTAFVDEFLDIYLSRGFGSLSKSEVDILVMHLLLKHGNGTTKSNHDLSLELQITEARLKNLRYQARLKYASNHDDFIQEEFFRLLENAHLVADAKDSSIIFVVEDSFVKQGIKAKLKSLGHFADHSFNSEVVRIKDAAFIDLLAAYFDEKQKKQIITAAKKAMKLANDLSFNEIMKELFKGMIGKAGEGVASFVASGLSGGLSDATTWASGIVKTFK